MQYYYKICVFVFLLSTDNFCHAQQMMRTVGDATQLKLNQQQFVGKPLKELIAQIGPEIKYVYGNPDNKGESIAGTNIKFFFIDKKEYGKRKNEKPTGILVTFKLEPNNTRKPIPIGGLNMSSTELEKNYGDMIVQNIYVTGQD